MSTLAQALARAEAAGVDHLDAKWLLGWILKRDAAWLISHDQDSLTEADEAHFEGLVQRRVAGEPYAYLVGEFGFHGLRLGISPAVLVPRPDTEVLVDWGLALLAAGLPGQPAPEVVDLGTGSGAIALAVKHRHPLARVCAVDNSLPALDQARANGRTLNLDVAFDLSDWWEQLSGRRFSLALTNPPYIAEGDAHLAGLRHEPLQALTPGGDGLGAIRRIVADAPQHLLPGGWLLIEHGWDQAEAVADLLRKRGFGAVTSRKDLGGQSRCTGGQWMAARVAGSAAD